MDERGTGLSDRSATILGLIAEGHSYDQILQQQPAVTYFDIFAAAREALDLLQVPAASQPPAEVVVAEVTETKVAEGEVTVAVSRPSFVERARATHRRAWTRWSRDEDDRLTSLFHSGTSQAEMVRQLERHPGAIRTRLVKLGLVVEGEGADPGVAPETHPAVAAAVEAPARVNRAPASPIVPGWEELRDRLTPRRETP